MDKQIENNGITRILNGKYGHYVYNRNDVNIAQFLEMYGEYSDGEVRLFDAILRQGDHAIDIGANCGALTLPMAQIVGMYGIVYAFEPQQPIFQTLCATMALNNIINVQCFPFAVSDTDGYGSLPNIDYSKPGGFGSAQISKDSPDESYIKIKTVKLDTFLSHIGRLDFIKIDVEGMEGDVVNGATKLINKFRPFMYIENDKEDRYQDLILLVQSLGYSVYWHVPRMFNPDNYAGNNEDIKIVSFNMICVPNECSPLPGCKKITNPNYHPLFNKENFENA